MRPLIGITCSFEETTGPVARKRTFLNAAYTDAIYADNSKANKLLGWNPTHSDLESIVQSAWAWYEKM